MDPEVLSDKPGRVSDLRHGAGAARRDAHRRPESRAGRHVAALLDRCGAWRAGVPPGDGRHGERRRARSCDRHRLGELDQPRAGDAGRALVRAAVLPPHARVIRQPQPEHVHADWARRRDGLRLQRRRHHRTRSVSRRLPHARGGRDLLRHDGGHHRARAARTGARAASPPSHRRRDPAAARPRAKDRAHRPRRSRRGCAARARAGRRRAARAAWGKSSGRRPRRGWRSLGRRVDDDRRVDPGVADRRRPGHRRDDDRQRDDDHPRRTRRQRHAARAHRADGRRGAAHAGADSAARRSGRRGVRPGGDCRGGGHVRRVGRVRSRAAPRACAGQRRRGVDHRLPVRAGAGDADGDHGRHRAWRHRRRADQERRGAGAARRGRHARRRQDRDADRRAATADGHRHDRGVVGGRRAAARRRRRTRQRTPAGRRDRDRRAVARDRGSPPRPIFARRPGWGSAAASRGTRSISAMPS